MKPVVFGLVIGVGAALGARPLDRITALRDIRAQSAPVDRDNRGPWNCRVTRVFVSCAAGESAQSSGSAANRVIPDWVAHASRVLAKVSHFRGLFEEDRFGETPKPTRETRVLPRIRPCATSCVA